MSPREITAFRWALVAMYALAGILATPGGTSRGEFVFLFVLGVWFVVAIMAADWINAGRRDDD